MVKQNTVVFTKPNREIGHRLYRCYIGINNQVVGEGIGSTPTKARSAAKRKLKFFRRENNT